MSMYSRKKEEDDFVTPLEQEQVDNSSQNDKIAEFDEYGTALNDI
ncbi:hypothetical protein RCG19_23370 [Neobacillus sp. OS1-2]|nr:MULTISPECIES: hypothetical protein [Bacillaceae]WML40053.1 hypothetical protein RCG19_23370 [Neobacillus sp. OS1-2]